MADTDYCARQARRHDPDRYIAALFAPSDLRRDLFTLIAFNAEVARSREAVTEPLLGRIRLQWWREAIAECYAGAPRRHAVVEPLAASIKRHGLTRAHFDRLIDAREEDLTDDPPPTVEALCTYTRATSGGLARLMLECLGERRAEWQEAAELAGSAHALVGLTRALPHNLRRGRVTLPRDLMARHGIDEPELRTLEPSAELNKAVEEISRIAQQHIETSKSLTKGRGGSCLPVLLQATIAEAYLRRFRKFRYDPFEPRNSQRPGLLTWRLMARAVTGRF